MEKNSLLRQKSRPGLSHNAIRSDVLEWGDPPTTMTTLTSHDRPGWQPPFE